MNVIVFSQNSLECIVYENTEFVSQDCYPVLEVKTDTGSTIIQDPKPIHIHVWCTNINCMCGMYYIC